MWLKSLKKHACPVSLVFVLLFSFPAWAENNQNSKPTTVQTLPEEPQAAAAGVNADKELDRYITPLEFGLDIQYASVKYPNYLFGPGVGAPDSGTAIFVAFEWFALKNPGKLGIGLEVGAFVLPNEQVVPAPANGSGYNEVATLYTFPVNAMVSYRFDYMDNNEQILVPFVKAGPGVAVSSQRSPSSPQWVAADYSVM